MGSWFPDQGLNLALAATVLTSGLPGNFQQQSIFKWRDTYCFLKQNVIVHWIDCSVLLCTLYFYVHCETKKVCMWLPLLPYFIYHGGLESNQQYLQGMPVLTLHFGSYYLIAIKDAPSPLWVILFNCYRECTISPHSSFGWLCSQLKSEFVPHVCHELSLI